MNPFRLFPSLHRQARSFPFYSTNENIRAAPLCKWLSLAPCAFTGRVSSCFACVRPSAAHPPSSGTRCTSWPSVTSAPSRLCQGVLGEEKILTEALLGKRQRLPVVCSINSILLILSFKALMAGEHQPSTSYFLHGSALGQGRSVDFSLWAFLPGTPPDTQPFPPHLFSFRARLRRPPFRYLGPPGRAAGRASSGLSCDCPAPGALCASSPCPPVSPRALSVQTSRPSLPDTLRGSSSVL